MRFEERAKLFRKELRLALPADSFASLAAHAFHVTPAHVRTLLHPHEEALRSGDARIILLALFGKTGLALWDSVAPGARHGLLRGIIELYILACEEIP